MKQISVFGQDAREIQEGQIFIAHKVEITEGDKVVLVPQTSISIPDPFED